MNLKSITRSIFHALGFEIHYTTPRTPPPYGSDTQPLGHIEHFLGDVRARGFAPRGIVDVGANRGDWARLALKMFPEAAILMIEPQEEMQARLTELAQSRPGCHYVKAGAGRESGELVQTIWPDLAGSSFLPPADDGQLKAGTQRKTPIITLDKLLTKTYPNFSPDLVKLDVQGFELEALAGGASLFGRTELFILETSLFSFMPGQPVTREVIAYFAERGYELYDIPGYLRRPSDGALGQIDLAFVKANGHFRASAAW
ncbi:MAG: FkbM family methyltransferase [Chthoniobacteraceae bacterium]|nr:FkbM family methyltransferase [Chthoniobacteraceae bacterium]